MRGVRGVVTLAVAIIAATSLSGCAAMLLIPLAAGSSTTTTQTFGSGGQPTQTQTSDPGAGTGGGTSSQDSGSGVPEDQFDANGQLIPFGDGSVSSRGLVLKRLGEPAGVISGDGTEHELSFRVSAIVADRPCPIGNAAPPAGEHFLTVSIIGQVASDIVAQGGPSTIDFGASNWAYFSDDSATPVRVGSGEASCDGSDGPSFAFPAGQRFSLNEVLVVPSDHGVIAFAADDGAWEWQY